MDLKVAKRDLVKIATRMQSVAERKSTMPALSNVLLTVEGDTLRLAATDLYLAVEGRVSAEVKEGGSVAVPAKDMLERIKTMPDGPIHIVSDGHSTATIKAAGSARRFTLKGMPGVDFPALREPQDGAPTLALEADILLDLIAKTHFSVSTDESRAHLNSALFEWEGDTVRMVTTDGHRLSKLDVKVEGRNASATMLLPLKAIHELRRLCEDAMSEGAKESRPQIQITQSGPNAFFQAGQTTFSVKLVDAQFPPYGQVIPKSSTKRVVAPRVALADALKAMSLSANERTGGVRFELKDSKLTVSSESPESGDGSDEVSVAYEGTPMTIGFNAKYFLDILAALDEEHVVLELSAELDPAIVRPRGEKQFLAVVMPLRV